MGKILDYSNLGAAPADNDLLFMGDYSADASNPTTMRLAISDLNKKRNIDAADTNGLMLRDNDGSTFGIMIHDGGNVGIGVGAATTPGAYLSVRGASDANLTLANFLNPSATTNGKYQQIIFGTDAANDKSVIFRYYYSTTDDASTLRIQHYEDAALENEIGLHLKGDGNVGIGEINPLYPLDVKGTVVSNGSYPLILDPSTGELKSNGATTLNFNKSANANISFMYLDSDGSTVNPIMSLKASNKRVSIGNESSPDAKLHIREHASGTATNLKLETYQGTGTVRTIQQFTQTVGASSLHHYLVWDGTSLGINNDGAALGAASVNFTGTATHGKIGINAAVGTRVLEATETTSPGIVADFKSTAAGTGSKILFTNTTNSTSVNHSQGLGFSSRLGSAAADQTVSWFGGVYRPSGASSTNYFALNYVGALASGGDSLYKIDTTLTNNEMYLDESGNVTFRGNVAGVNFNASGNVAGDAFYDKGGTTVGNYCRGRFVQTFTVGMRADNQGSVFPALNTIMNLNTDGSTHNGPAGYSDVAKTPDARYMSRAPFAGKLQRIDLTTYFPDADVDSATMTPTFMFYSGSLLPSAGGDSGMGTGNSAYVSLGTLADDTSHTLGFNSFTDTAGVLEFDAGDYLAIAIDVNTTSGFAYVNLALTVEFNIT